MRIMAKRVSGSLRDHRKEGLVRSEVGPERLLVREKVQKRPLEFLLLSVSA